MKEKILKKKKINIKISFNFFHHSFEYRHDEAIFKSEHIQIDYNEQNIKEKINNIINHYKCQGSIYCLDKNFLDVAKKEISEEDLIKYFKE